MGHREDREVKACAGPVGRVVCDSSVHTYNDDDDISTTYHVISAVISALLIKIRPKKHFLTMFANMSNCEKVPPTKQNESKM